MVETKQISLAIPKILFKESQKYSREYGYKNLQGFILDLLRRKVMLENVERYREIESEMRKTGKRMTQKDAVRRLEEL